MSALTSKSKGQPVQMVVKNQNYTMEDIPKEWSVTEATFRATEEFVCQLYGKKCTSVDLLRYELHYTKAGQVEPEAVPPCHSSLRLHVFRANYQVANWRRASEACPDIPWPHRHGWNINSSTIEFVWLRSRPAPEEVLHRAYVLQLKGKVRS